MTYIEPCHWRDKTLQVDKCLLIAYDVSVRVLEPEDTGTQRRQISALMEHGIYSQVYGEGYGWKKDSYVQSVKGSRCQECRFNLKYFLGFLQICLLYQGVFHQECQKTNTLNSACHHLHEANCKVEFLECYFGTNT